MGAGGIGFTFYEAFRAFQYDRASAIIVITVSLIDILSSPLRKMLL